MRSLLNITASATLVVICSAGHAQDARETINSTHGVAAFERVCLRSDGEIDQIRTSVIGNGGYDVTAPEGANLIARHNSHQIDIVTIGIAPNLNCTVRFAPDQEPTDAFFAALTALAETLETSEDNFEQFGVTMSYEADFGTIVLRGGTMVTLAVTFGQSG